MKINEKGRLTIKRMKCESRDWDVEETSFQMRMESKCSILWDKTFYPNVVIELINAGWPIYQFMCEGEIYYGFSEDWINENSELLDTVSKNFMAQHFLH